MHLLERTKAENTVSKYPSQIDRQVAANEI